MKKLSFLFSIIFTAVFVSCNSLPKNSRIFTETVGAPVLIGDRPVSEYVNGLFPDEIFIKTLVQTFSFEYEYQLYEGKIYYKKRGTDRFSWTLFKGTGLPFSEKKDFEPVEKIVEIAADADVLYAFSQEGKLYRCYTKKITSYPPFDWVDYFGWPLKIQLYQNESVANKKTWAVGSSRLDVQYYEDTLGNQHNYGPLGVESIPMLCEDGVTIRYCDPACPSDFSHMFKGPENGLFVMENLSESASTFMVIGKNGTIYTRLMDFNTVGSDPMLYDYSYKEVYSDLKGDNPLSNTTTWALPNEPWKKEPPLPEGSKSTTLVTIIQNGKGNSARELRVAGINKNGDTGFFYKSIDEENWNFKVAALELAEEYFTEKSEAEYAEPEIVFQHYKGGIWHNGKQIENFTCVVDDFHFAEGPFTLHINSNDFSADVEFYFSEIWSPFLRREPGFENEPVRYFGTSVFNPNDFFESPEDLKNIFGFRNKAIHEFYIEAYNKYLLISVKHFSEKYEIYLTEDGTVFGNPETDIKIVQKNNQLEERLLSKIPSVVKDDRQKKKVTKNLRYFVNMKNKERPTLKRISPKLEIICHYSGEICGVNKDFYKSTYKLDKKYISARKKYEKICKKNEAPFDSVEVFKYYLYKNLDIENKENLIFYNEPFFPMALLETQDGIKCYIPKKGVKSVYKYYTGKKKKIKLRKN